MIGNQALARTDAPGITGASMQGVGTSAIPAPTLMARFAAAGFRLEVDVRARAWRVSGAGGERTFHSQVEAEGFLDRQGRAA